MQSLDINCPQAAYENLGVKDKGGVDPFADRKKDENSSFFQNSFKNIFRKRQSSFIQSKLK